MQLLPPLGRYHLLFDIHFFGHCLEMRCDHICRAAKITVFNYFKK
jgi:hypothetical protein